jgi:ElaB/YqjD/DUF883 family membrane-anchored ribosome-binding protein
MPAKDSKPDPTAEELPQQIDALRADVAAIAETLQGLGLAAGQAGAEGMKDRARQARAGTEARIEEMHARLEAVMDEADRVARDRPATAMGISAGLGFLVGLLLGRR